FLCVAVRDGSAQDVDRLEQARLARELRDALCAAHELGLVEGGPRDAGDPHERSEIVDGGGESARDGLEERAVVCGNAVVRCRGSHAGNLRRIVLPPTRGIRWPSTLPLLTTTRRTRRRS